MTEWQPTETPPQDGEVVLVAHASGEVGLARRKNSGWWSINGDQFGPHGLYPPPYWMPLPPPPPQITAALEEESRRRLAAKEAKEREQYDALRRKFG